MDKKKKGMFRNTGTMMVFVVVMLALYFTVINKPANDSEDEIPTTEIDKLLVKDMENDYPENPREVIKLYGRYSRCLYNEPLSEEDFERMVDQMRVMFAADFLSNNPREDQIAKLLEEKKEYKKRNRMISNYSVQKSSQTVYKTLDSAETATIGASLLLTEKTGYEKIYQEYMLRDEEGKWKIVGFQNVDYLDVSGE